MNGCHDLSFLNLSFKPAFSLSSFTFIKRLFSSSSHFCHKGGVICTSEIMQTKFKFRKMFKAKNDRFEMLWHVFSSIWPAYILENNPPNSWASRNDCPLDRSWSQVCLFFHFRELRGLYWADLPQAWLCWEQDRRNQWHSPRWRWLWNQKRRSGGDGQEGSN